MDKKSIQLLRVYEVKLKNQVKDFTVNFKKRYDKFPWQLITKIPNSSGNEVVVVRGSKFTVKSLKAEILKVNKNLKSRTKPSGFNTYISAYKKEAIHAIRTGGDLSKVYHSFNEILTTQFKQTKDDLMFCIEALRQLTKYLKEKDKEVKESYMMETKRSELDDSEFGIPKKRKFPLDTEEHVKSAIKFFNYADDADKAELARRIKKKAKEYNITLKPGKTNKLSNYIEREDNNMHPFDEYDEEIKDILLESFYAIADEEDDEEEFTEGQNLQMRDIFKQFKAERKVILKEYKKAAKAKDYITAKKKLLALKDLNKKVADTIGKFEADSVSLAIFSYFTSFTVDWGHNILVALTAYIPIDGLVNVLKNAIERAKGVQKAILAKGKESSTPELFNGYRAEIIKVLYRYDKAIDAAIKNIDVLAKKDSVTAKESSEFDDSILELYENCAQGLITIEEREAAIEALKESHENEIALEEALLEEELAVEASKHEKLEKVKKVLYEKCANNEISEDQREELISEAYNRIFDVTVEEPEQDYSDDVTETADTTQGVDANASNNPEMKKVEQEAEKAAKEAEKQASDSNGSPQPSDN